MNDKFKFLLVFSMVLFIGLGLVSAGSVDESMDVDSIATGDANVDIPVSEVVEDYGNNNGLGQLNEGDSTGPGANPTQYTSISQTTYENAVITLSGDQSFTDGVATFSNNVTLKSDSVKRTLSNLKIVISGNNVTINNVVFNHQTSTATKVIDVTNGASDVLINNTDITLTKNDAVTTMAISVSNNANNVVINSSNVDVSSASQGLVWQQDANENWYSTLAVGGVVVNQASNVKIANGSVKIVNTTNNLVGTTMPAIVISNGASNVEVINNTINATGAQYNYGIMCNDYVSDLDIKYNRVNVTGEVYTAGMDVSTSTSSEVKYNNITANSTNSSVLLSGSEALSYGIVLATYQLHNNNNVISYNNINLVANVGYGIENYMGSVNTIEYNNITIHAKRTIGIATNASNNNNYKYNNINLYCNNEDVNYFYETIPAQNVGIIVIGANSNNIQFNNITINEDSTNTDTYTIILASDTSSNTVKKNILYVYNTNGISKQSDLSVLDSGVNNNVLNNYPTISINYNKNLKSDNEIIIDENNVGDYASVNDYQWVFNSGSISSNSNVIVYSPYNIKLISFSLADKTIRAKFVSNGLIRLSASTTVVDTYLPGTRITTTSKGVSLVNSTFLDTKNGPDKYPARWSLENSTILTMYSNYIAVDDGVNYPNYNSYFDSITHMLLDSVAADTTIVLRSWCGDAVGSNSYPNAMIINKPVNLVSYDNTTFNADITFVAGSEGSNITGLTLNGNLYINTSNINVKNNTINKSVFVNDGSNVLIEENTFNTEETAIVLAGALQNTIQNNNITTTSTYTITLDEDSAENTITNNNLQAAELTGVESILDNGEDNTISLGGDEPVVVEPVLKVDTTEFTVGETATITASIYKGDEVASDITGGKVVFKVNGVTLKDANGKVIYAKVVNGVATISDYVVPDSWNKENLTISAVYSGSKSCEALRSEAVNMTVTKTSEPSLTVGNVTSASGETVTLTATVSDGNTPITIGKVVFKVNGKTVKDANGKVVYAVVGADGTVSVDYVVLESMKAKGYVITAVFTSSKYDRLTSDATLTVSN